MKPTRTKKSEPADIERLLGIAMGCIGMSHDDFCRCAPSEFYAIYRAWNERRESQERATWERTRMQCLCMLQPYSKNKLRAQDIMRFPWENPGSDEGRVKTEDSSCQKAQGQLSHDEVMARYREAKKRAGL